MSKEKQIDEMANYLYENRPYRELWLEDAQEIAEVLYNAGYRKQSDVVMEIIGIIDKRREVNQYHLQGNNTDLFHGIYCGRDEAYRDIAEIIEKKYGAKMKGGAE